MASIKVLDRFLEKLDEVRALGEEARKFEDLVAKHESRALRDLLDRLRPLMEYVDGPIATREEWVAEGELEDRKTHHYKEPGIVLVNNFESSVDEGGGPMRHTGYKVIFTRSGKLVQLDRQGSWSEDQNATFWACDAHEVEPDPAFAERHMAECVASIAGAVERAADRQRGRRDLLKGRLKMLKAVQRILDRGEVLGDDAPAVAGHGAG